MLRKLMGLTLFGLLIWGFLGIQNADAKQHRNISGVLEQVSREEILSQKKIPVFTYRIQKTYPHNITSYTEGLLMDNGYLFEGTGRYGKLKFPRFLYRFCLADARRKIFLAIITYSYKNLRAM